MMKILKWCLILNGSHISFLKYGILYPFWTLWLLRPCIKGERSECSLLELWNRSFITKSSHAAYYEKEQHPPVWSLFFVNDDVFSDYLSSKIIECFNNRWGNNAIIILFNILLLQKFIFQYDEHSLLLIHSWFHVQ